MALFEAHGVFSSVAPRTRALSLGLALLAGVGLILGARELTRPRSYYVLVLHAEERPGAIYFSAFEDGPVYASHDASDGETVVYRRDFTWADGCAWQATEELTPDGGGYRYHYDEHLVGCPAGVEPSGLTTPRGGYVHVVSFDGEHASTPLSAISRIVLFE